MVATPEEIAALEAISGQGSTSVPPVPAAPVDPWTPPGIGVSGVLGAIANMARPPAGAAPPTPLGSAAGLLGAAKRRIVDPVVAELSDSVPQRAVAAPAVGQAATDQATQRTGSTQPQASDAELIKRLEAAAAGAPQVMTTTQFTGSALDPRLAAQLARESSEIAKQRIAAQTQGQREYAAIAAQRSKIREGLLADSQALQERLGKAGKALSSRLDELDARIAEGEKELSAQEYVPLGRMSRMDQAILAISAAIEGGSAASLRRPSNASAMIKQAIELDRQEYEEAVKSRIRSLGLDKDRQSAALQRMQSVMSQMQDAAGRSAELQMAEIASRTNDVGRKMDAVNTALGIREGLTARKEQIGRAVRGRTTKTKVEKSGGSGKDAASARKSVEGVKALVNALGKLRELRAFYNKHEPDIFGQAAGGGTKTAQYLGMMKPFKMELAKASTTGTISDQENASWADTVPQRNNPVNPWGETTKTANIKFNNLERTMVRRLAETVGSEPATWGSIIPRERPGVLAELKNVMRPLETQASVGFKPQ